ncbi:MAG TPA: GlsB/YeaQ/YmgE family stress response membrane protein [Thermoanaerobaculia bacterium]|nr:GlsB/YeaQ/YmgE family stress response membrane protein [Thermoanaerobaculia bacterium]
MNFIMWLIVGGLIGWIASIIMRHPEGILMNVVVGIVGSVLAGFLLSPLFGVSTINQSNFSLPSLLVSLLGSVILLAIVNLFRRGTVR